MNRTTISRPWPKSSSAEGALAYWAIGAIYAFAFISPQSISLGYLAQFVLLVIAIIFTRRHYRSMVKTPMFWIALSFIFYVLLRGLFAALIEQPELADDHFESTSDWARAFVLPVLIFGMALVATGNWPRHAVGALIAAALGIFLFEIMPAFSMDNLSDSLVGGTRLRFGIGKYSETGLVFAAALIAALAFAPSMLHRQPHNLPPMRQFLALWRPVLWLAGVAVILVALFATKTRTAWIGGLCALAALTATFAWYYRDQLLRPRVLSALFLLFAVCATVTVSAWDEIERRMMSSAAGFNEIVEMDSTEDAWALKDGNLGARMAYKVFAIQIWLDRPIFGWGPADPYYLMGERPLPPVLEGRSGHFHDSHVETLARLGIIGWILILAFLCTLMLEAGSLMRTKAENSSITRSFALSSIGFSVLMLIWMLGVHHLTKFHTAHILAVFLGPMAASVICRVQARAQSL